MGDQERVARVEAIEDDESVGALESCPVGIGGAHVTTKHEV
jgi:hypothetical protein